jgi:replicative DNA helicase
MIDRVMPHNVDLEEAVLGACLIGGRSTVDDLRQVISPESFYQGQHRKLFAAICELADDGVDPDPVTISEKFGGEMGVKAAACESESATTSNANYHAGILAQLHMRRSVIVKCEQLRTLAFDSNEEFDSVLAGVSGFDQVLDIQSHEEFMHISAIVDDYLTNVDAAIADPDGATGIKFGIPGLDKMLGGLKPSRLLYLAARPAMGKTALALEIANHARSYGVGIISMEMEGESLVNRMVARQTGINSLSISHGQINNLDRDRVANSAMALAKENIYINTTTRNASRIEAACRQLIRRKGVGLIVVDYLQLLEANTRKNSTDERELAEISKSLKLLAVSQRVPVLALSQLSRAVEDRPNKRPIMRDLRGSGSLEQDADAVMFMYRPEYYGIEQEEGESTRGLCEIIVGKHRHGPTGTVKTFFNETTGAFGQWENTSALQPTPPQVQAENERRREVDNEFLDF